MFESAILLFALVHAALVPTTTHPQLRDANGEAWMEIRAKRVMILHAPRAGQLQLRIRSAGAKRLRIRAGGEEVANQKLDPSTDPGAGLTGASVGRVVVMRVPVPSGGEIFRLQVKRGKAWVAAVLVSQGKIEAYAQPDSEKPILVGLGSAKKSPPSLVDLRPERSPQLARLGTAKAKAAPGLVGLGKKRQSPGLIGLGVKSERGPALVTLGESRDTPGNGSGPAAFDRPVTELPSLDPDDDMLVSRSSGEQAKTAPSAQPREPNLIQTLLAGGIPLTVGGGAEARAGKVGGQIEAEMPLPGRPGLLAAAVSIGYSQSRLVAVASGANGTAAPITLNAQQTDLPIAFALRVRPLSLNLGKRRLTLLGELGAAWSVREEGLSLSSLRASVRDASTPVDSQITGNSGVVGQLGLGVEVSAGRLSLGAGVRYELAAATDSSLGQRVTLNRSQSAPAMQLILRYRFGS
jgi:hypothetical protein